MPNLATHFAIIWNNVIASRLFASDIISEQVSQPPWISYDTLNEQKS